MCANKLILFSVFIDEDVDDEFLYFYFKLL